MDAAGPVVPRLPQGRHALRGERSADGLAAAGENGLSIEGEAEGLLRREVRTQGRGHVAYRFAYKAYTISII